MKSMLAATLLLMGASGLAAQAGPVTVSQLTDQLYRLHTDQGSYTTNTLAFIGDDGLLLVDTQSRSDAQSLREAVEDLRAGAPTYIINTHRHAEHVGGNDLWGEAPTIIAHALVPDKLRSGGYIFDEFPRATYPDITVADSLTLFFNGERIRIIALPGSHDDTEIIVHFTESKVVHLSSIVNGFTFPSVDAAGDVLEFAGRVQDAIDLLPPDVTIVSGHNGVGTWEDLHAYRDMLLDTERVVRAGLEAGKDVATLQEEQVLSEWSAHPVSYVSLDSWIEYVADALDEGPPPPPMVYEPLYAVWKERGAEAAVAFYFDLKRDHAEQYSFYPVTLLAAGIKVMENGHVEDAVVFLEGGLQDDEEAEYSYYTLYMLADAHDRLGDPKRALEYCDRSLELNPDYGGAQALRERLGAG